MSDIPGQSRIDIPGALHYIILRSIERRKIFRDDKDRIDFVQRFGLILEKAHVSDSNFVSEIMEKAEENVQKKYMLKS